MPSIVVHIDGPMRRIWIGEPRRLILAFCLMQRGFHSDGWM